MPELPEVETVKCSLERKIIGVTILKTEILLEQIIKMPEISEFKAKISGRIIQNITRHGKYLKIHLSGAYVMVIHLRMTGQLLYMAADEPVARHTHIIFYLNNGAQLRYVDIRQFGTLYLLPSAETNKLKGLSRLGLEPVNKEFSREYLKEKLQSRTKKIKQVLLEQEIIAGLGNIYADEILFAAKINPHRPANSLATEEVSLLHAKIVEVIQEAIEHRGTSVQNYIDGNSEKGNYQNFLKVYQREAQNCVRCDAKIKKEKLAGRGTHFCPECQK